MTRCSERAAGCGRRWRRGRPKAAPLQQTSCRNCAAVPHPSPQPGPNTVSNRQRIHDTPHQGYVGRERPCLNRHLAATIDLHAQLKQAHWNVRPPSFIATHQRFDRSARRVEARSDVIAERAAALGGTAGGTIETAVERSFLAPYGLEITDERSHLSPSGRPSPRSARRRARRPPRPPRTAIQ
jgi:hypothetical protein